jgi:hypothetical protein
MHRGPVVSDTQNPSGHGTFRAFGQVWLRLLVGRLDAAS